MHFVFCITHQPNIAIDLDRCASIVWLGAAGQAPQIGHPVLDVHTNYPDLMAWHAFLTGASGTFAIRRFLCDQQQEFSDFDLLTLTQYRKFISRDSFGGISESYPSMRFINDAARIPRYADWFVEPAKYFLISRPLALGSMFGQYANVHHAPDLLRYLAIAVELEIITGQECLDFINHPVLIPAGIEVGTFPVNIFLTLTKQLEAVCLHFLERHRPIKIDAYQRRALAFCNERLGSYLLQKVLFEIFDNTIPQDVIGNMHTVDIGAADYRIGV